MKGHWYAPWYNPCRRYHRRPRIRLHRNAWKEGPPIKANEKINVEAMVKTVIRSIEQIHQMLHALSEVDRGAVAEGWLRIAEIMRDMRR